MSKIRKNIPKETVLSYRDNQDAYTRKVSAAENIDHVVELQLVNFAAGAIVEKNAALQKNLARVVNAVCNLNVTSQKINQSKKGPFTASLNRLKKGVEHIDCDELARKGRARWLVEDGTWDKIKEETVLSFDAMSDSLADRVLTRAHAKTLDEATEAVRDVLEKIKVYS